MSEPIKLRLKGAALLEEPRWNKGSAFTKAEREAFDLRGRLPYKANTLDEQVNRAYDQYKQRESDILKNSFLQSLKSQNWILFYALLSRHTTEMYPIIYTPTEADAIQNFSHLFRRPEGLFLVPPYEAQMEDDFLSACDGRELDLVVVSDAEAILGIGDQGSGGIGISSAKAVIYTLAAGIDPSRTLAVTLDVGTDNDDLLNDDLYIGYREKRLRGDKYDHFVDKFVELVRKHQPHCLLHFEDFGVTNAHRLLGRYRDKHSVFNDDIQGTGAVTLAALTAALAVTKGKLHEQRIVIYGAGSAGMGIARQLRDAIKISHDLSDEEAGRCFYLVDKRGLLKKSKRKEIRDEIEDSLIRDEEEWGGDVREGETGLEEVVKRVKPTVLIGTSTHKGAFTETIIKEMAKNTDRPIVFPLSNPISKCEADPKDVFEWSSGKALLATGSPFPPIDRKNGGDQYIVAECNNALIYPGLGLGTILSGAKTMTDKMIVAGAHRLGELAPAMEDADQALLPDFGDAANVNFEVALAVMAQAIEDGDADSNVPQDADERKEWAKGKLWKPEYREYVYDPNGLA